MKKSIILMTCGLLLLSSCNTYTGSGAYSGGMLGSILGSAIGGISGGARGSDLGTIVGMAGGAIIGGAIGQAQDQARQRDIDQYEHDREERAAARARRHAPYGQYGDGMYGRHGEVSEIEQAPYAAPDTAVVGADESGYDASNSGDDRLYDFQSPDYTGSYSAQKAQTAMPAQSGMEQMAQGMTYNAELVVRNARFVDDNQDGIIERGEICKIIFEVVNRGTTPVYDVQPTVIEATGNRHIFISPNMHVERLMPGKGIRYTAMVKADNRLKEGTARFCVSVIQGGRSISQVSEFHIPTRK